MLTAFDENLKRTNEYYDALWFFKDNFRFVALSKKQQQQKNEEMW